MVILSEHNSFSGTDGGTMLGAVAGLGAILLVFLLYIKNKTGWWFTPVRGMNCCEEACPPVVSRSVPTHPVPNTPHPLKNKLVKAYSFDGGESSSESEMGFSKPRHSSAGVPIETTHIGNTAPLYPPRLGHDLISLVEKGRVGISSNSSCCSSTTSSVGASVGEKHGVLSARITGLLNESLQGLSAPLRETKIDNQGNSYQKDTTDDHIEQIDSNGNRDCIVVMNSEGDERTEVMSQCVSEPEPESLTKPCGHLEIAVLYDAPMRKMTVHVLQARNIQCRDRSQPTHTQVRLILLPSKKQKHKTKIRSGENPQYIESFVFHRVNPEDVNSMGVRLRLYGCERMRRERLVGEAVVSFANINLELENNFWLNLEPRATTTFTSSFFHDLWKSKYTFIVRCSQIQRSQAPTGDAIVEREWTGLVNYRQRGRPTHFPLLSCHHLRRMQHINDCQDYLLTGCGADLMSLTRSDSTGSAHSMQHGGVPELLLGLCYNATTGRLNVEVVKGSHFSCLVRNLATNRAPDTYVKLNLISSTGQELAHSKTTVRRGQPNPLFKETFVFQVALFQLADVTLMVSVYSRKGVTKKKEMVGWFSLGLNSSGAEELAHWMDMKEFQQEQIARWHILVQS